MFYHLSPSMRREWIEMIDPDDLDTKRNQVSLHAEGVD